jgi:phenylacetate-CoA ligase
MQQAIANILLKFLRSKKAKILTELTDSQWLSGSEIKEIQNRKFIGLMKHCQKNIPFYKSIDIYHSVNNLDSIFSLPLLTKELIKNNIEELKSINHPKDRFIPNSTSGSTGEGLKFFSDSGNQIGFGILIRNNMWTGWKIGERQLMLWGSHGDISSSQRISNRIKEILIHKRLYLSSYEMTERNMQSFREKINKYKPTVITAYPSSLFLFATYLEMNGLSIYSPKGIITSGETLYEDQRDKIESIFNCNVFNRYGCREVGNIAHECDKHNGLHINAEHVFVETLNEKGNACKPGELGEIVITDLDNYAFPFIRYKTGDIGTLSDRICDCGRGLPLLETVEGRIWDIIVGANGNRIVGTFWLVKDIDGINQFQICQEKVGELVIRLVVKEAFSDSEKQKIVERVHHYCGKNMKVIIKLVENIPLTDSGKHRFVLSKISPFSEN